MTPRLASAVVVAALATGLASHASATSGTAFGESSRVAALGGAVTARPGDPGSMLQNPAGLADITEPELVLAASAGQITSSFGRTGESEQTTKRWVGGYGFAVGTPLPGWAFLRRFRIGIAFYTPADRALRVAVDERSDQPRSPIYDGRPDRMSGLGALAVDILPELKLGIGAQVTPSLDTPTEVSYDAGRGSSVERNVVIRLDRDLQMGLAPFAGLRVQPLPLLGMGLSYRSAAVSKASGKQRTVAGGILADDPIDYYQFWDPAKLTFGVAGGPIAGVSLSIDATYSQWSTFRSGFDKDVSPPFKNTVDVGAGVEWQPEKWLAVRAGYTFEPSPIPAQSGNENFLGADTHVLAVGGGVNLRELVHAPLVVDAYARARLGGTQNATKNAASLPDANPDYPGQQIDNLGFPGFRSSAKMYQVGLTLTLFVGKEKKR